MIAAVSAGTAAALVGRIGLRIRKKSVAEQQRCRRTGGAGEKRVSSVLSAIPGIAFVDDIVFRDRGTLRQVDHIVLAGNRIVCLETKTWRGRIKGGLEGDWATRSRTGRWKRRLNPITQNEAHRSGLEHFLRTEVTALVVIVGKSNDATHLPDCVVGLPDLPRRLEATAAGQTVSNRVKEAWRRIEDLSEPWVQGPMHRRHEQGFARWRDSSGEGWIFVAFCLAGLALLCILKPIEIGSVLDAWAISTWTETVDRLGRAIR